MPDAETAPWAQTYTGRAVDLLLPKVEQIHLDDICVALERLPRFNGHTTHPWSVAAHSLCVADALELTGALPEPAERLAALLHDAHEAYTGDIISPMQAAIDRTEIRAIQAGLQQAIHQRFGLPASLPHNTIVAIKQADLAMLAREKDSLMAAPPRPWIDLPPPAAVNVFAPGWMAPGTWRQRFIDLMCAWHGLRVVPASEAPPPRPRAKPRPFTDPFTDDDE